MAGEKKQGEQAELTFAPRALWSWTWRSRTGFGCLRTGLRVDLVILVTISRDSVIMSQVTLGYPAVDAFAKCAASYIITTIGCTGCFHLRQVLFDYRAVRSLNYKLLFFNA